MLFWEIFRNGKGQLYGLSSYISLRAGLNWHINNPLLNLSWCLLKDTEFITSNTVFTGVVKMLRKRGLDTTVTRFLQTLTSKLLSESWAQTPRRDLYTKCGLTFSCTLGAGETRVIGSSNPRRSSSNQTKNGFKYATLTFNEHTKNHNDPQARNREGTRGSMMKLPGDPLCSVSLLAKYLTLTLLPPDAFAFYLHPRRKVNCDLNNVW